MTNDPPEALDDLAAGDDPRLNAEFWRALPATDAREAAAIVGVVHDHPASSHRVRAVAGAVDPDVLGLELPATAVSAFERAPRDGGDEMRAAIAAADAEVVGIDTFGPRFLRRFAGNARRQDASLATVRDGLAAVGAIVRDALAHRLGTADADRSEVDHGVGPPDPPAEQARDERTHVARSRSLLGAVERPHVDRLLDETREENMAARIDALRRDGSVVAVVGVDHLDSVAAKVATGRHEAPAGGD